MKRRRFIVLASLATAGAGAAYWYFSGRQSAGNSPVDPQFLSRILDTPTIRSIGETYLKMYPENADEQRLLQLLGFSDTDEKVSSSVMADRIKEDFDAGNLVVVNGWVLSLTEARQCALFYITKSN